MRISVGKDHPRQAQKLLLSREKAFRANFLSVKPARFDRQVRKAPPVSTAQQ